MEKFNYEDLASLALDLPEDVLKRKCAGDFDGAKRLIGKMLKSDETSDAMKTRLRVEEQILERLPGAYPLTFDEVFEKVREKLPDVTVEELRDLQDRGQLDWIYIHGEERFTARAADNLMNDSALEKRSAGLLGKADENGNAPLSEGAANAKRSRGRMRQTGKDRRYFRMKETLTIRDDAFRPGEVKVYLPVPVQCAQISDFRILGTSTDNYHLAAPEQGQRTICFMENLKKNEPFSVEFEFTGTGYYHDFWSEDQSVSEMYRTRPQEPAPTPADLAEQYPHIRFTPFLRSLCGQLCEGCETPLEKARSFYNYLTLKRHYSYVRSYFLIENQGEYFLKNGHGDCGLQALAMICLCRIAGIPARWQSGNAIRSAEGGCHDWCQIYLEPYGWIGCDPSCGGDSAQEKREFYFGNLDPLRLPCNSAFQQQFDPPMQYLRDDPYDNQSGEVEYADGSLTGDQFDTRKEILVCEER